MKRALVLVVSIVAVAGLVRWRSSTPEAAAESSLFANRVWIDRLPRGERDTINALIAISDQAVGVFDASSRWRGAYELFRYEASGEELRLIYPQSGKREAVRIKARRCDDHGMDFCLEVDGASRGVKRYYSKKGWEIEGGESAAAAVHRLEALRDQLAGAD
jgi:hypothetical protein